MLGWEVLTIPGAQLLMRGFDGELERAGQRTCAGIKQLANPPHELIHERFGAIGRRFSQDREAHHPSQLIHTFGEAHLWRVLHRPARHDPQL